MNAAQVHLLFNHWPLILIFVGFFVLLIGERNSNMSYKKLGLFLLISAALFAIPTQFSGEGAAHILSEQNLAESNRIEKHESLGFWSAILAYGIGVIAFISLIMIHNLHSFFTNLRRLTLVLAAGAIVLIAIAAHTGGEIRHTEIRINPTE